MMSSSFQISRLKTVSKKPCRFSLSLCLCMCYVYACVWTSVVFFFTHLHWCVCTGVKSKWLCVFFHVSQCPHLCLHKCSQESCSNLAGLQVHGLGWGVICVCVCVRVSVFPCCSWDRYWDIIALWLICIRKHQNIVANFFLGSWSGIFNSR